MPAYRRVYRARWLLARWLLGGQEGDPGRAVRADGWHRDHARKAFRVALQVKIVRPRKARPPT